MIKQAAGNITCSYPNDLEPTIESELIQFSIEIALRIYLSLMVSYCSGERSFSKLKRIKNELRNRIEQDRLNSLSIMSIESDVLRQLDFFTVNYGF